MDEHTFMIISVPRELAENSAAHGAAIAETEAYDRFTKQPSFGVRVKKIGQTPTRFVYRVTKNKAVK